MGNHGILFDTDTLRPIGMAPVFDNNLSFCPRCVDDPTGGFYAHARENCRPAIGSDFLLVARAAMTDQISRRVEGMTSFEFDRGELRGMPEGRIETLEAVVRTQARALLDPNGGDFNLASQRERELAWQLDGWSDDSRVGEYDLAEMISDVTPRPAEPDGPNVHPRSRGRA